MSLTIGELARRLRISTRALRHYEDLGLLVPEHVDPRTGYRTYGADQLTRGMQIEQLKATGLSLADIRTILDSAGGSEAALRRRRQQVEALVSGHLRQIEAIDALLVSAGEVATPELVDVEPTHVIVSRTTSAPDDLTRTIRREIQQLGRSVRQREGVRCRSFSVRFPLDLDDCSIPLEVYGHLVSPCDGSIVQPAETQLRVVFVGDISLLPLAYDVVLTTARERGLQPTGSVVEHYLDLATVGRTEVAVPILTPPAVAGSH